MHWQKDTIPDDDDTARMRAKSPNPAVIYSATLTVDSGESVRRKDSQGTHRVSPT